MSNIRSEMKRVLDALAFQDAGDYLSGSEKNRILGIVDAPADQGGRSVSHEQAAPLRPRKRIALITDGRGTGAPLAYAAEACARQGAGLDIVLHGSEEAQAELLRTARRLGVDAQVIRLAAEDVEQLVSYICNHPSLVYLVGICDDDLVRTLAERVVPARGGRMHVPLVLIEDRQAREAGLKTAASL